MAALLYSAPAAAQGLIPDKSLGSSDGYASLMAIYGNSKSFKNAYKVRRPGAAARPAAHGKSMAAPTSNPSRSHV
jgi:hypothetical protein